MNVPCDTIRERVATVEARLARALERSNRDRTSLTLVAVSKTMPVAAVVAAYEAGLRHFGENRVQEGVAKVDAFHPPDVTWHLIGHLQTNKARPAVRSFGIVESVDSHRVAQALSREAAAAGRDLDILIEVNMGGEASKFGLTPAEAAATIPSIAALPCLRLRGLMTVAPLFADPEDCRPVFRALRDLSERTRRHGADPDTWHLSMGMSHDVEVAIQEGATIVRIGRAIFGERTA